MWIARPKRCQPASLKICIQQAQAFWSAAKSFTLSPFILSVHPPWLLEQSGELCEVHYWSPWRARVLANIFASSASVTRCIIYVS